MKKLLILVISIVSTVSFVHAQKLNKDTLAKYSKKSEQIKVFNKVAADIHLDTDQNKKFDELSATYASKAIEIIKDDKTNYTIRIKQILSPDQLAMLRSERDKYHFARRFVSTDE